MAPPPAMTPTGEEIFEAADVMAAAIPSSMFVAVVGRKAQRAMLQLADEDEIADLAMAAERLRRCENHVIADLAIVPDMAAIHEVAALADAGDTAAGNGAGVHGDGFADGAARADLEPGQFAAIAQALRRRAERDERIDDAAVADRGLRGDVHMRDQLAVGADNDVGPDDAIGADRGPLADHSAI